MSLTAIILIIISACMHASWNFASKSRQPSSAFFLIAAVAGIFALAPAVVYRPEATYSISMPVLLLLISTGFFQAIYFMGLAGAYRSGHMSIAYPIARALPAILTLLIEALFWHDRFSWQCVVGIPIVVVGSFLLPMKFFHDFKMKNYWNATCLLALMAAAGTAGYSIIDYRAMKLLNAMEVNANSNITTALTYLFWQAVSVAAWLLFFVIVRGRWHSVKTVINHHLSHALFAGVAVYYTYALVVIAMKYATNVSYVVGFRQLSIPIGALMGIVLLKEPKPAPKLLGIAIILAGAILIAVGRT